MFDFNQEEYLNNGEDQFVHMYEMLISTGIPELKCDGLCMKKYRELTDKLRNIALAAVQSHDLKAKQDALYYLSLIEVGIDSYMETH